MQRKSGVKLTEKQVLDIYLSDVVDRTIGKLVATHRGYQPRSTCLSSKLANEYGISSKSVRDIWNHRTWSNVTAPYRNKIHGHVRELATGCVVEKVVVGGVEECVEAGAGGVLGVGYVSDECVDAGAGGVLGVGYVSDECVDAGAGGVLGVGYVSDECVSRVGDGLVLDDNEEEFEWQASLVPWVDMNH